MDDTNVQNHIAIDSPLGPGYTGRSDEARMKQIDELMDRCTNFETRCNKLESQVLDLNQLNASQAKQTTKLKQRVKVLEGKQRSRITKFKRLGKVGTTQVVSSSDDASSFRENASKQGRNETEDSGEA
jgi:transposase